MLSELEIRKLIIKLMKEREAPGMSETCYNERSFAIVQLNLVLGDYV